MYSRLIILNLKTNPARRTVMLTRVEKAQQKWGGSHTVIDKWLNERQELIVLLLQNGWLFAVR